MQKKDNSDKTTTISEIELNHTKPKKDVYEEIPNPSARAKLILI